ncbi:MAG: dihydroneopterin aldolase [Bacteroidota bacterium]|nr:dihydroneopterin aldolase [Bacteroidota bacterium]
MSSHFTIQLNQLRFFAAHGVYAQEALAGNEFEVDIALKVEAPEERITALEQTINYAEVYRITKEIFEVRRALLETLAMEIAESLKQAFPALLQTTIQITKLNPPIAAFTGSVSVTYHKDFAE